MSKKKVLIVDDDDDVQAFYRRTLNDKVLLLSALTIKEAEELFATNPDLDAIVMDACVPEAPPTTIPLVRKMRETFDGPMIASSGDKDYRQMLVNAGCDHESKKGLVPQKLLEVLGL